MTRAELEHAIRAACDVADETAVIVFGSQAILGKHPDAPEALRQSMEADIAPASDDPHVADRIDGALGEGSHFHRRHGFYVHGLTLDTATLPRGWDRRTVTVRNPSTNGMEGRCLEAHDLAASKLAAFRDKDRAFVRTMLAEGMIRVAKLRLRLGQLDIDAGRIGQLVDWVDRTMKDLPPGGRTAP